MRWTPAGRRPGSSRCRLGPRISMASPQKWPSPGKRGSPGPATTVRRSRLHLLAGIPRHCAVVLHRPQPGIGRGRGGRSGRRSLGRCGGFGLLLASTTREGQHRAQEENLLHLILLQGFGNFDRCLRVCRHCRRAYRGEGKRQSPFVKPPSGAELRARFPHCSPAALPRSVRIGTSGNHWPHCVPRGPQFEVTS